MYKVQDSPVGPACQHAAGEGTLTIKLIQGLAKLRIDWQNNRLIFGTSFSGLEDNTDEADFNLNTVLAEANQFPTTTSRMQLSKKAFGIVR